MYTYIYKHAHTYTRLCLHIHTVTYLCANSWWARVTPGKYQAVSNEQTLAQPGETPKMGSGLDLARSEPGKLCADVLFTCIFDVCTMENVGNLKSHTGRPGLRGVSLSSRIHACPEGLGSIYQDKGDISELAPSTLHGGSSAH